MPRTGIAFSGGPPPAEIVDCVKLAEQLGYESAWVAEGHGGDQFAELAACATQTSRILLGTSITSVFVRTAPTIAMAAATLDDLTDGRFILGVGSSHKVQVEAEHGMTYGKPLTRVRETVEVIRRLLQDGRVSYRGETVHIRYNRMMAEHGFVEEAAAIAAAWSRGDREAAERAVSDELIDATSVAGTPCAMP